MEHDSPGNQNQTEPVDSAKAKQQHKEIERRRRNRMKAYFEEMEQIIPNIIERNRQKKRKLDKIAILSETNEYIKELRSDNLHGYLSDAEILELLDLAVSGFFFVLDFDTKKLVYISENFEQVLGYNANDSIGCGLESFIHEKHDFDNLMEFIRNAYQPSCYMFDVSTGQFEATRFNSRAKRQVGSLQNSDGDTTVAPSSSITPTKIRSVDLNLETTVRFNYSENFSGQKVNNCWDGIHYLSKISGRVCCLTEIAELNPKNSSSFCHRMRFDNNLDNKELLNKKFFFGVARMANDEPFSDIYSDPSGSLPQNTKIGLLTFDKNFMIGSLDSEVIDKFGFGGRYDVDNFGSTGEPVNSILDKDSLDLLKQKIQLKKECFSGILTFLGREVYPVSCSIELILNAYDEEFEVAIIKIPL